MDARYCSSEFGIMPDVKELKGRATMTMLEKYAGEVVVAGILMLLSWNSFTTYQNALALRDISSSIRVYGETLLHVSTSITTLNSELRAVDKRISAVELTRWSRADHREFRRWIEKELNNKVDR